MGVSDIEQRLTLPRSWRFRCFRYLDDQHQHCGQPATRWSPDPDRADAATFYCDAHAPIGAEPIADDRPFVAVELAATVVVGGATTAIQDARANAVTRATQVLADAGMKLSVVATSAGLLVPRAAPVPRGPRGALTGPRSSDS